MLCEIIFYLSFSQFRKCFKIVLYVIHFIFQTCYKVNCLCVIKVRRVSLRLTVLVLCYCLGSTLLRELKKLDDKVLLVEVQLMESQVYYKVGNLQKSRAALTSSRTTANTIYCPPRLQASLDLLSGMI